MSDITIPVNVAILVPHALVSACSVSIFLQEHQDVLPLNTHRAFGVSIALTLLCCRCYESECLQRAMAVLAFKADTQCGPYKHLFEEQQWQSLVELFYQELYRLNNLTPQSVLAVHLQVRLCAPCCLSFVIQMLLLHASDPGNVWCAEGLLPIQAGISALKPPIVTSSARKEDPLALEVGPLKFCCCNHEPCFIAHWEKAVTRLKARALHCLAHAQYTNVSMPIWSGTVYHCAMQQFQKLAEGLPYSKHIHSTLICPVTLEVMNEDNPPMVAPSGAVYSEKALCQISAQHNGMFKDPETGVCSISSQPLNNCRYFCWCMVKTLWWRYAVDGRSLVCRGHVRNGWY